ncbi:hypothetical protein HZA38_01165 [Candidatus Peregrinibacteria bacterium]|nr:hypothetical protein [Candidatus Peregrinibacteria bacterium]
MKRFLFLLLSGTLFLGACSSPSPSSNIPEKKSVTKDEVSGKDVYTNSFQKYSLEIPLAYRKAIIDKDLETNVKFKKSAKEYFFVKVSEEPESEQYEGVESSGDTILGGFPAKVYVIVDENCKGDDCAVPPKTVVRTYKNGKMYAMEFWYVKEINGVNDEVMKSFTFLE